MKRALLGTKRKKATPARKPVAKRSKPQKKSSPAKAPAKRPAPTKRAAAKTIRPKLAKRKVVRLKVAKAKAAKPKRQINSKRKTAKLVAARKLKLAGVAQAKPVTPVVAPAKLQAKPKNPRKAAPRSPRSKVPAPAVAFAIEADEELAMPATVLPETRVVNRRAAGKPASKNKRQPAGPQIAVPAFLLEGDEPGHPEVGGPGQKFSLGPTVSLEHFSEAIAPLPDSYGTGKIFLTARDPHWLYAHWDFTREEQFRHNARSVDRHLVLRVHNAVPVAPNTKPVAEYHVHPESKHWFVHVERAGESYMTELGYYQAGRKWKSLSFSAPQRTPPDNISKDSTVKFATIPAELSFETMLGLLKETAGETVAKNTPLAHVVDQIRPRAPEHFPEPTAPGGDWTPEQEQALAGVIAADQAGGAMPGSAEFVSSETDIMWPEFAFDYETGATAPLPPPTSYVSSFFGGAEQKDFWFNVNAELIIYGATAPNATVTFAGKPIQLRADGSFRCHFALPDGQYELPVTAVSADGTDGRAAELKFTRSTEVRGHVTAAPGDPALSAPPTTGCWHE